MAKMDLIASDMNSSLARMLDSYDHPAILVNPDYRILATNDLYREKFGEIDLESTAARCYKVSHNYDRPCDQAGEDCPLAAATLSGQRERVLHIHQTPRGEEHVDVEMLPILDEEGKPQFFVELLKPLPVAGAEEGERPMVGASPGFNRMLEMIARVAPGKAAVLLLGESGTGKELAARTLHQASLRASKALVTLECAGLTEALFESELFGHVKGAFTGANYTRQGLAEAANGGTLFLDEIGDMPLALQTRLLRVLAEGDYYRVGGRDMLRADARVIAATHQDLEEKVDAGSFREDLYHRLNVIRISLPPLRDRTEDIEILARRFLLQVAEELGLEEKRLRPETVSVLQNYPWPGNVRQLLNLCRQLCVMAPGDQIFPEDLPGEMFGRDRSGAASAEWSDAVRLWARKELMSGKTDLYGRAQAELERVLIDCALDQTGGQRQKAAELLGLGRNTLTRKLQKIDSERNGDDSLDQAVGGT
jgi:DNA-binding NtrC family response regulator